MLSLLLTVLLGAAPAPFPQDSAAALVEKGRAQLLAGDAQGALATFEQASRLDGERLRTRVWVLRTQIELGRAEDALEAADELARAGEKGPDLDYVHGMGLYDLALRAVTQGQAGSFTGSQFGDAVRMLQRALAADAERYGDAWLALAEAAWYVPDLDSASTAIEKALAREPKSVRAHMLRGRIGMSQYVALKDDLARAPDAERAWKAAVDSFTAAAAELSSKADAESRAQRAEALVQSGSAQIWKQDPVKASQDYAAACAVSPTTVDFRQVLGALGSDGFEKCVASAKTLTAPGRTRAEKATLGWWHGYALYAQKQYAPASAALRSVLAAEPTFFNSWYYIYKCEYAQQRYAEAIAALASYSAAEPDGLTQALASDLEVDRASLEYLIGWCADPEQHGGDPLNLDAAELSEILTRVEPDEPRHWNNLGLFVRDHGEELERTAPDTDPVELEKLWERALAAYERSLALAPDDPNYLNDTALMLHYHLVRDLPRAKEMYAKAYANAVRMLESKDLPADERERLELAKRDSKNNLELLEKELEKRSPGAAGGE